MKRSTARERKGRGPRPSLSLAVDRCAGAGLIVVIHLIVISPVACSAANGTEYWLLSCIYLKTAIILSIEAYFLPRDALQCKARSCDRMSSVRPSVYDVRLSGLWSHRLEFFENNFTVS